VLTKNVIHSLGGGEIEEAHEGESGLVVAGCNAAHLREVVERGGIEKPFVDVLGW